MLGVTEILGVGLGVLDTLGVADILGVTDILGVLLGLGVGEVPNVYAM